MQKALKIILIFIFILLIGIGSYFISKRITENYIKNNKIVEDINIKTFIDKFNKNLKNNNIDFEVSIDNIKADNNKTYWINLEEDIDLAIMVDKISDNINNDIVRITGLAFSTNYKDSKKINNYLEIMLDTNNPRLTEKDKKKMIDNANDMSKAIKNGDNKTSPTFDYKGLGIDKNINSETTMYRIARYK